MITEGQRYFWEDKKGKLIFEVSKTLGKDCYEMIIVQVISTIDPDIDRMGSIEMFYFDYIKVAMTYLQGQDKQYDESNW